RRNASTTAHVAGAVWLGNESGLEERSRKPSTPSARNRPTHLATVFGVVLYSSAAAALLNPPSITARTIDSRPFDVREAFLWLFIWSLRRTLKLRNLSFLGSDQMDNLLKAHSLSLFERKPAPDLIRGGCRFASRKR